MKATVRRYLDSTRRVTLSIVPQGRGTLAAPNSTPAVVS